MIRDAHNVIPISMAVLLHVLLLGSMLIAFEVSRTMPITPLAIQATVVTEIPDLAPPAVAKPEPEPEPEPEPVAEQPEPVIEEPEPDNSEELRRQAEEEKRKLDALLERERLEEIRQQEEAERKRKEEEQAERRRKETEEAERKKREEEEKERKRIEAEKQREEDIRRQREENERLRREAEAVARADEISAEEDRLAAVDSGALAVYMEQIRQKIYRNWSVPASASPDLDCAVRVRQLPGGDVTGVTILTCNGDDAVKRSIEAAVMKASPLPEPSDPNLFDRNILLNLSIRQ